MRPCFRIVHAEPAQEICERFPHHNEETVVREARRRSALPVQSFCSCPLRIISRSTLPAPACHHILPSPTASIFSTGSPRGILLTDQSALFRFDQPSHCSILPYCSLLSFHPDQLLR